MSFAFTLEDKFFMAKNELELNINPVLSISLPGICIGHLVLGNACVSGSVYNSITKFVSPSLFLGQIRDFSVPLYHTSPSNCLIL